MLLILFRDILTLLFPTRRFIWFLILSKFYKTFLLTSMTCLYLIFFFLNAAIGFFWNVIGHVWQINYLLMLGWHWIILKSICWPLPTTFSLLAAPKEDMAKNLLVHEHVCHLIKSKYRYMYLLSQTHKSETGPSVVADSEKFFGVHISLWKVNSETSSVQTHPNSAQEHWESMPQTHSVHHPQPFAFSSLIY